MAQGQRRSFKHPLSSTGPGADTATRELDIYRVTLRLRNARTEECFARSQRDGLIENYCWFAVQLLLVSCSMLFVLSFPPPFDRPEPNRTRLLTMGGARVRHACGD
uniref:Uncharacterized protein n=1 Tax=Alexandrium monilatum TaxID=311494 RepID=A0A7S4SYF7_9DINO